MKKIILVFLLTILIISGCNNSGNITEETIQTTKKDFIIETRNVSEFSKNSKINKSGKLVGKESITLSSQASGKIKSIKFKEGDYIDKDAVIIELSDNYSRYGINIDKTRNNLVSAKLNYTNNEINLNKAIQDAKIALEKAQLNHNTTVKNTEQDLKKAEQDFENNKDQIEQDLKKAQNDLKVSNFDDEKTQAKLSLEKLQKDLENANFDLTKTKEANQETINGFKRTIETDYSNLKNLNKDIITFSDKLLGISDLNKQYNDNFEAYLGAKNTSQKEKSKQELIKIINFQKQLDNDSKNINNGMFEEHFNKIINNYNSLKELLNKIEITLNNSVVTSEFSQTQIDGYKNTINQYQSSVQGNISAFTSFKNSAISFLNSYENNQESIRNNINSLEQQIEISKKQYENANFNAEIGLSKTKISSSSSIENAQINLNKTKISIENIIKNSEITLKIAQNNLDTALKNKTITLQNLNNNIKSAEISLFEAQQEYNKLFIKAPINGTISKILVDEGQEITNSTPVLKINNSMTQEIEFGLTNTERQFIGIGQNVKLTYNGKTLTGTIISMSNEADENLNYNTKVLIENGSQLLGDFIEISIDIQVANILIPINIVTSKNNGNGLIYILENNEPKTFEVNLGKSWGELIEITNKIPSQSQIITSDIKNYDKSKYNIVIN